MNQPFLRIIHTQTFIKITYRHLCASIHSTSDIKQVIYHIVTCMLKQYLKYENFFSKNYYNYYCLDDYNDDWTPGSRIAKLGMHSVLMIKSDFET